MRRSSRPAVRWFAAGLTALSLPAMSAFSADAVSENAAYTYTTPAGEKFFGVSIRATDLSRAHRPADRHVLLIDTSASQVGDYRLREVEAAKAFLTALPSTAKVAVVALDVTAEPLTAGFVSPREALESGLAALDERVPLGATDIAAGLSYASEAFGDAPTGSIVYVGDGMSGANLLRSEELSALTSSLRANHIPVHAYSVGVNTDWHLLGVLAHQTGGIVELDSRDADAALIGQKLAKAAAAPVVYPQAVTVPGDARLIAAEAAAPLRSDRDTLLLGRGERPATVSVNIDGQIASIDVSDVHDVKGLPAIRALALSSEKTGGLDMPAAGQNLLAAVDGAVEQKIERLADAATIATKSANLAAAKTMFTALSDADPAGRETERLQIALAQAEELPPPDLTPPAPTAVEQDLIGAEIDRQRILTQQMTIETSSLIDEARQIRQSDPGDALNLLKRQDNQVRDFNGHRSGSTPATSAALEQRDRDHGEPSGEAGSRSDPASRADRAARSRRANDRAHGARRGTARTVDRARASPDGRWLSRRGREVRTGSNRRSECGQPSTGQRSRDRGALHGDGSRSAQQVLPTAGPAERPLAGNALPGRAVTRSVPR